MKAPIESTLTLEKVAEHFEHWRRQKKNGERIPESLWDEALALVDTYGSAQVARTLRLGGSDLNRRRQSVEAAQRQLSSGGKTAFVEIDRAVLDHASGAEAVWMELQRPDGLRLRIPASDSANMLALVDRFMGI